MRRLAAWTLPCALACSFDGTGQSGGPGSQSGVTTAMSGGTSTGATGTTGDSGVTTGGASMAGTTGAIDASTTDDRTTGPMTLTGVDPTTGDGTTSTTTDDTTSSDPSTTTSTTSDDTTTTGPPDDSCQGQGMVVKILELVDDAVIMWPMEKEWSQFGEGTLASSPSANQGTVDFTINVPCSDNYILWGRVVDQYVGAHDYDPDSFFVNAGGLGEVTWIYGCQTDGNQFKWSWERVQQNFNSSCNGPAAVTVPLAAGTHHIVLRNRESENDGARAGIARLIVTNDPNFVPMNE